MVAEAGLVVLLHAAAAIVAAVGGDTPTAASVELVLFYCCWSNGVALVAMGLVLEVSLIATWG